MDMESPMACCWDWITTLLHLSAPILMGVCESCWILQYRGICTAPSDWTDCDADCPRGYLQEIPCDLVQQQPRTYQRHGSLRRRLQCP